MDSAGALGVLGPQLLLNAFSQLAAVGVLGKFYRYTYTYIHTDIHICVYIYTHTLMPLFGQTHIYIHTHIYVKYESAYT